MKLDAKQLAEHNAPIPGALHTAIWTGNGMLIWGGLVNGRDSWYADTGGSYDPEEKSWQKLYTQGSPPRYMHSAVWTGDEMLIWGGRTKAGRFFKPGDGLAIKFKPGY